MRLRFYEILWWRGADTRYLHHSQKGESFPGDGVGLAVPSGTRAALTRGPPGRSPSLPPRPLTSSRFASAFTYLAFPPGIGGLACARLVAALRSERAVVECQGGWVRCYPAPKSHLLARPGAEVVLAAGSARHQHRPRGGSDTKGRYHARMPHGLGMKC